MSVHTFSRNVYSHPRLRLSLILNTPFKLNYGITESIVRSVITPPQARQVVGRKTKLSKKLTKLVDPQGFCEYFGCPKIGVDVLKVDIPSKNTFSDELVVHLNVLCLSMEDGVSSKMDIVEIVVVEQRLDR